MTQWRKSHETALKHGFFHVFIDKIPSVADTFKNNVLFPIKQVYVPLAFQALITLHIQT